MLNKDMRSEYCLIVLILKQKSHSLFTRRYVPEEQSIYLGSDVRTEMVMKSSVSCDIMPCSQMKVNRRFGGTCRLHLQARRISHLLSRWHLARLIRPSREPTYSSETSVDFQRTTRHYIPEDSPLNMVHICYFQ
jgi:hypothetical protein